MAVGYSPVAMLLSLLLLAIGASMFALGYAARAPQQSDRLLRAGVGLGFGFAAMHHLGLRGLQFGGFMHWSWGLVALCACLYTVAAAAALWLAFRATKVDVRAAAAVGLGLAFERSAFRRHRGGKVRLYGGRPRAPA